MATSTTEMVNRTRRFMRDFPQVDVLQTDITDADSSLDVSDGSQFVVGDYIELDMETMKVTGVSTNTLDIMRGVVGSIPAPHTAGVYVLRNPKYYSVEIIESIADGIDAAYPIVYKFLEADLNLTSDWEYSVPSSDDDTPLVQIYDIRYSYGSGTRFRPIRRFNVRHGAGGAVIEFQTLRPGSTARVYAVEHFPRLGENLDDQFPTNLEYPLVEYAGSRLLASGEIALVLDGELTTQDQTQTTTHGEVIDTSHDTEQTDTKNLSDTVTHDTTQTDTKNTQQAITHNVTETDTDNFDGGIQTKVTTGTDTENDTGTDTNVLTGTDTTTQTGTDVIALTGTDTETHTGSDLVTMAATEAVKRVGSHAQIMQIALNEFLRRVANCGYPPMPRRRAWGM